VHVTVRMAQHVWNLRSRRSLNVLTTALYRGADRFGMKVVQASVQGNHCHLLVEADRTASLTRGMKGLGVRIAKGLNRLMGRRAQPPAPPSPAHTPNPPREARTPAPYIRHNPRHHMEPLGARFSPTWVDPFTSGAPDFGLRLPAPRTWLVRQAWPRG